MANPNVLAPRVELDNAARFSDAMSMGMLPVALSSAHPTIVFRWRIQHITAPMVATAADTDPGDKQKGGAAKWRDALWVEAWVYALFSMRKAMSVFSNAWTSLQENKLEIMELKSIYDEARKSPHSRLLLLTEFKLGLDSMSFNQTDLGAIRSAIDIGLRVVQRELDELER
jgi:hypothetical protein